MFKFVEKVKRSLDLKSSDCKHEQARKEREHLRDELEVVRRDVLSISKRTGRVEALASEVLNRMAGTDKE